MIFDNFILTLSRSLVILFLILSLVFISFAEERNSTNYQITSDSINFGGGFSSSTNFSVESTLGEIASGDSDSLSYKLKAGYQQMQEIYISISNATSVEMTPSIGGVSGGVSNGTTSVVVTTDSPSGYQLTISSENSPAMQKGSDTISDYVPQSAPDPDFSFNLGANDVHFAFSPEGLDVVDRWKNDGVDCNSGTNITTLVCWDGLSTTEKIISQGNANHPSGATTTLHFKVGIGGDAVVKAGDYFATTTVTALPL